MTLPEVRLVRGGLLLNPRDTAAAPRDLLIVDDAIAEVGPPGLTAPQGATIIDASDRLIIPGLVNAHTHGHGNLAKGLTGQWTLELFLNALPATGSARTLEDLTLSTLIGAVEMLEKGCTTCYDMHVAFPVPSVAAVAAVAEGYRQAGMRARLAPMMADRTLYQAIPGLLDSLAEPLRARAAAIAASPTDALIAASRAVLEHWPGDRAWLAPALGPTIPLHCSDRFLVACRDLAAEHEAGLQVHLGESRVQMVSGQTRYGTSLTRHLDRLGLLGPRFTAAHGVWLDDADRRLLAERGAAVAHNPGSNLRLGSGVAAARMMLAAGITVGLGTDAAATSDNQNMFEAMRLTALVSRLCDTDHRAWLGPSEAFAMATEGSAAAAGWAGRIGRIEPGYRADMVLLDLSHANFTPANDVLTQLVFGEDATAVDRVLVGGRTVVEGGRCITVDRGALKRRAEAAAARLRAASTVGRETAAALEGAVGSFCMAMRAG